jgi:hypothetical protein
MTNNLKSAAWLGLLVLLTACSASGDGGCDQVCQQAQYDAIESLGPVFYNLGTALHK